MPRANDSIAVTPGAGESVATHLVASKKLQLFVPADESGYIQRTKPTWVASTGNTAHVAAARTTLVDLFNAPGSGVTLKVQAVLIIPALAAVSGVGQTYEIIRTSSVGSGGTGITPATFDSANSALPSQVTAGTKPTGGAATAATLLYVNGSSEETNAYAALASQLNHVAGWNLNECQPLVLREGEGLKVDQTTNSNIGNVNVVLVFTVE